MQLIILGWTFLAFVVGILGRKTRVGFWGSFIFSIFLTPLLPLILILLTSDVKKRY
jgi:hypothetical protein